MEVMIRRYVREVLRYLPILDRRKARRIVTATIRERLEDYTDGHPPIKKDVKAVLRELGHPAKLAYAYYADFHTPMIKKPDLQVLSAQIIQFATVFAYVLVGVGICQLLAGGGNLVSLVLGVILAIMIKFYQVVVFARQEYASIAMEETV